ncbi:MAG: protein kinase [Myxococcota bacterium]|nr:protein kinase [Myxococcota bacterium]
MRVVLGPMLSQGGMAELYLATRHGPKGFERRFVVKRILPQHSRDPVFVKRLIREATIAANLDHPNIIDTIELSEKNGEYFIVMEYLSGKNLSEILDSLRLRTDSLVPQIAAHIVYQVADALVYLHEQRDKNGKNRGLTHRDICPANIMVTRNGAIKLIDFGISKEMDSEPITLNGKTLGTPAFISPQRAFGHDIDQREDIYGLGAVFYAILVGEAPFNQKDYIDNPNLSERIGKSDLFSVFPPTMDLPRKVQQIIKTSTAGEPAKRYNDMRAMHSALRDYLNTEPIVNSSILTKFMTDLFGTERIETSHVGPAPIAHAKSEDFIELTPIVSRIHPRVSAPNTQKAKGLTGPMAVLTLLLILFVGVSAFYIKLKLFPESTPPQETSVQRVTKVSPKADPIVEEKSPQPAPQEPIKTPPQKPKDLRPKTPPKVKEVEAAQPEPPTTIKTGTLVVRCESWGWIHLDGKAIGTCPINGKVLPTGKHVVELRDDFGNIKQNINIKEGKTSVVDFR